MDIKKALSRKYSKLWLGLDDRTMSLISSLYFPYFKGFVL